jgi:transposase
MASGSMAQAEYGVTVGVDTHGDANVAAAFSSDLGRPLGYLEVATTPAGYRRLLEWARGLGNDPRFGVEGTGSYGAGLARFLDAAGCTVIEVNRPNRQTRYARGKSDPVDAEAAARAVISGEACGLAKGDTGQVGMIRALRVARRSALKMRTQTFQQMKALLVTAPADLREQLRTLSRDRLVDTAAGMRPGPVTTVAAAVKLALRGLAQRHQLLTTELATLDGDLDRLVRAVAPTLCALTGVGTDVAGAVLVAAGDNPQRLRSEGAFAKPVRRRSPASVFRKDQRPAPAQPRRRSPGQLRALARRDRPPRDASADQGLHGSPDSAGNVQAGDHPVPQALRGTRGVSRARPSS